MQRKGYRLAHSITLLTSESIERQLSREVRGQVPQIQICWICDSTNSTLMRQFRSRVDLKQGSVLLAEQQTAGRGRRGKEWISPFGGSIYLSIFWKFEQGAMALSGLGIVVGVAIAEALIDLGVEGVQLKWPNDIYLYGKKLGGILVEVEGEADGPTYAVIGAGVNLVMSVSTHEKIDQPAASLSEVAGVNVERDTLAAAIINRLVPMLNIFSVEGLVSVLEQWKGFDLMRDADVELDLGGESIRGIACGINDMGALQLKRKNGDIKSYYSGDLSLRLAQ